MENKFPDSANKYYLHIDIVCMKFDMDFGQAGEAMFFMRSRARTHAKQKRKFAKRMHSYARKWSSEKSKKPEPKPKQRRNVSHL